MSSSAIVGALNEKLVVDVLPKTKLSREGSLVISFPEYYENSGSDAMISTAKPKCETVDGTVTSCEYN
jgi:hypothetical protein